MEQEPDQNDIEALLFLSLAGKTILTKSKSNYIFINNSSYSHLDQFFSVFPKKILILILILFQ